MAGQVNLNKEALLGLYDYQARWMDPLLGRFTQADTIVPGPGDPLAWDRYSYGRNNPVRYVDPTGHAQACMEGDEGGGCGSDGTSQYLLDKYLNKRKSGEDVSWNQLTSTEKNALERADWNPDIWYDAVSGPGVTAADPLHDPVFWISALFGTGRMVVVAGESLIPAGIICVTGGNCNGLAQTMVLESFESAVSMAVSQGIQFGQTVQSGSWELIFGPPSQPGLLPTIFHAFFQ